MNLIEKLGGYESAYKFHLDRVNSHKTYIYDGLDKELLNYRRENNIFEVGDAIIRKWNNRLYWIITDVDNGSEFMISENRNAKFKYCKVCDMPCNFKHATDEEIKTGHRLDSVQY